MALSMGSRLKAVEEELRARTPESAIKLFWHDELIPCLKHDKCCLEPATGEHHRDIIVLSWEHRE